MANERGNQGQANQGTNAQGTGGTKPGDESGMQGDRTSYGNPSGQGGAQTGQDQGQTRQDQGQYRKDESGSSSTDAYGESQVGATTPSGNAGMTQPGNASQDRSKTSDIQGEDRR